MRRLMGFAEFIIWPAEGWTRWFNPSYRASRAALVSGGDDRPAINELDPVHVPGAAWRAAAQRLDGQAQLVAGFERLAVPTVAGECARAAALEIPSLGVSVLVFDVENNEGVRAGIFVFLDHAGDLLRVLLVKHREGVMGERHTGETNESSARQHGSKIGLHAFPPFDIAPTLKTSACAKQARQQNTPLGCWREGVATPDVPSSSFCNPNCAKRRSEIGIGVDHRPTPD